MKTRAGQRVFLRSIEANELADSLNQFFESNVNIPRVKVGKKQSFNSLICEETSLFARYLRKESESWVPRLPAL
ncbi:MAG: CRISPR-associated endonuclease Cas1 [Thermoproteota archaeon]|nr:CRISPR-associated endonuclease Cas1 [Thermoproteota archaeon]